MHGPPPDDAAPESGHPGPGRGRWRALVTFASRPVVVFIAVGIIAAIPRFDHLGTPAGRVFDEIYYSEDGCLYAGHPYADCDLKGAYEKTWMHPPLGKWMIAAGIKLFGNRPFGWRVSAALVGTLTCVLVAMLAFLLWRSSLWAFVAGVLAATESLLVVQSRTALLDIFEAFWVVAGFLFLVLDRGWIERRTPEEGVDASRPPEPVPTTLFAPPPEPGAAGGGGGGSGAPAGTTGVLRVPSPFWRPWRVATGIAFGLATAVKWSAATALLGAVLLTFLWERTRRRRAGVRRPFRRAVLKESLPVLASLFLLPVLVYLASYSGRIEKAPFPPYRYRPGLGYSWLAHPADLARVTVQMEEFHRGLKAQVYDPETRTSTPNHPYESSPWSWLVLGRPVSYFYKASAKETPNERRREVLGIGNPAIFWVQFLAIPWLAVMWRRRRDWRAGLILVAILSQYLFWFVPGVSLQKVQFFFYATPIAPFFVLGAVYLVRDLARMHLAGSVSRPFLPVSVAYVVVAVAMFVWFWPVLSGAPLTVDQWEARFWFRGWI